ncbi:hypothetical protein IWQ56_004384, partial [Coemansia nantahalensis]
MPPDDDCDGDVDATFEVSIPEPTATFTYPIYPTCSPATVTQVVGVTVTVQQTVTMTVTDTSCTPVRIAPGLVIVTGVPAMPSRLHAGKAAKSSREKGKRSHYERVHDDSAGGSSGGAAAAILSSACYAAAEDDHLGWQLGDAPFDPMYTVRRREREANATGKDSFLKKLK